MFFSSSKLVLLILTLVQLAIEQCWTFSFVHRKWDFLLPRDLMEKIFALEADAELDKMEVERLTDQLLKEVPRSVLEQLELPRFYSRLPFNIRWQIKELLFDKSLVWSQKHEAIFALIQTLPSQMRRFAPIQHVAQSSVDDLSFARPTLAGTGHSRLFESLSALKYTVSFTFQTKELCEILPQPLEAQLYTALSSNKLNIEQKLAAVENVMSELPFGVLDRLFFVGVPIVDAEVRERFRRLWYDRPYWSSDAGEEEGIGLKMQNSNNVDSPMLLNLPVPSSSAQQDPIGRASIFYQHQLPSSQPIIPPLKPPKKF
uniref:Uncharacterized protein n=1 Tax=Globodera rostochiensis TaxID=31243 RepID=A0A914IDT5_GLORO